MSVEVSKRKYRAMLHQFDWTDDFCRSNSVLYHFSCELLSTSQYWHEFRWHRGVLRLTKYICRLICASRLSADACTNSTMASSLIQWNLSPPVHKSTTLAQLHRNWVTDLPTTTLPWICTAIAIGFGNDVEVMKKFHRLWTKAKEVAVTTARQGRRLSFDVIAKIGAIISRSPQFYATPIQVNKRFKFPLYSM